MAPSTAETGLCNRMNADHPLALFAIVKSTLKRSEASLLVKDCKTTTVTLTEAKISYVACQEDSCAQREVIVKFDPPLKSLEQMR